MKAVTAANKASVGAFCRAQSHEGLEQPVVGGRGAEPRADRVQQVGQAERLAVLVEVVAVGEDLRLDHHVDQLGHHHEPLVDHVDTHAADGQLLEGPQQRPPAPG
ncbi:hypothetical protein [Streptomyces sp. NPDC093225]|uniref:hypothetical protein n=1 Tax=Streptomyces sp. NPDC093225 TaxID=3366034 RepID=UPI00381483AB